MGLMSLYTEQRTPPEGTEQQKDQPQQFPHSRRVDGGGQEVLLGSTWNEQAQAQVGDHAWGEGGTG